MMIVRGVNVFPTQIEELLLKIEAPVSPHYQIVLTPRGPHGRDGGAWSRLAPRPIPPSEPVAVRARCSHGAHQGCHRRDGESQRRRRPMRSSASLGKAKRVIDKAPRRAERGGSMARPRAADHDLKRRAILDRSARGCSPQRGYARTSMSAIASACGSSKALLYHYYENKEQLLLRSAGGPLHRLEEAVKAADAHGVPIRSSACAASLRRCRLPTRAPMPCTRCRSTIFRRCRCRASRTSSRPTSARLVDLFASVLRDINPSLAKGNRLLTPVTMSLFGMINWSYLWFRPGGPMSRSGVCQPRHADDGRWHRQPGRRCSRAAPARAPAGRHRLSLTAGRSRGRRGPRSDATGR